MTARRWFQDLTLNMPYLDACEAVALQTRAYFKANEDKDQNLAAALLHVLYENSAKLAHEERLGRATKRRTEIVILNEFRGVGLFARYCVTGRYFAKEIKRWGAVPIAPVPARRRPTRDTQAALDRAQRAIFSVEQFLHELTVNSHTTD